MALLRLGLVSVVGVLLAAGCGGSAKQSAGTSTGERCATTGDTGVRTGAKPTATTLLTEVKTEHDACVDRITFTFKPKPTEAPGYRIEYRPAEEAQTEDGSGNHIAVAGSAFLVVRFEPAATVELSGDQPKFTYP